MRAWFLIVLPFSLSALPKGEEVAHGQATFQQVDSSTLTIHAADKTIINYKEFNVAEHELVHFQMRGPRSTVLNRVKGSQPSNIFGKIKADGKVFFVNPNGIIFGPRSEVNVGSLIASTLDIQDTDFLNGKYRFFLKPGSAKAKIVNEGVLQAAEHGLIGLFSPQVINKGVIMAQAGKVALLSGEAITLDFSGDGLISFTVEGELQEAIIEHLGKISASQGDVVLRLAAAKEAIRQVVNLDGLEEGIKIIREKGIVRLVSSSHTASQKLSIQGNAIDCRGSIQVSDSISLSALDIVSIGTPIRSSTIEMEASKIHLGDSLDGAHLNLKAGQFFSIGADVSSRNTTIPFNAPVFLMAPSVTISTGDLGGDIVFKNAVNKGIKGQSTSLTLSAGLGDIHFEGGIQSLDLLTVSDVRNMTFTDIDIGGLIQQKGTGTALFKNRVEIHGKEGLKLNCNVVNFNQDVLISKGGAFIENSGALKVAEKTLFKVAKEFQQIGRGESLLGGSIVSQQEAIFFHGPVVLIDDIRLTTPDLKRGRVTFYSNVEGPGSLEIECSDLMFSASIGKMFPLSSLSASARGGIALSNIGGKMAGVTGTVQLTAKEAIVFQGNEFCAGNQIYKTPKMFQIGSACPTLFSIVSSQGTIRFEHGEIFLSAGTDIKLQTIGGNISIGKIRTVRPQNITLQSQTGAIYLNHLGYGNHLQTLNVIGDHIAIEGGVKAQSIILQSNNNIDVKGNLEASEGNLIFHGPVVIQSPKTEFSAGRQGEIRFHSTLDGKGDLYLVAQRGRVTFDANVGKVRKLASLTVTAQEIHQRGMVKTSGPITYTGTTHLREGLYTSQSPITFNGSVFCANQVSIGTGFGSGDIIFTSTLDGDKMGSTLSLNAGEGNLYFLGSVGSKVPIGEINLSGSRVCFHNMGTVEQRGIDKLVFKKPFRSIDLQGDIYHIGDSKWSGMHLEFLNSGIVQFLTDGNELSFRDLPLQLSPKTTLNINTNKGAVQFSIVKLMGENDLTIQGGEWISGVFSNPAGRLQVIATTIELQGPILANEILFSATEAIRVGKAVEASTTQIAQELPAIWNQYAEGQAPHIKASGSLFMNAIQGNIGQYGLPILLDIQGQAIVGAKHIVDLKGVTGDQKVHPNPFNKPQLIIFNGREYYDPKAPEENSKEQRQRSLTTDLGIRFLQERGGPSGGFSKNVFIYYEPSSTGMIAESEEEE